MAKTSNAIETSTPLLPTKAKAGAHHGCLQKMPHEYPTALFDASSHDGTVSSHQRCCLMSTDPFSQTEIFATIAMLASMIVTADAFYPSFASPTDWYYWYMAGHAKKNM